MLGEELDFGLRLSQHVSFATCHVSLFCWASQSEAIQLFTSCSLVNLSLFNSTPNFYLLLLKNIYVLLTIIIYTTDYQKAVETRQKLDAQLNENNIVKSVSIFSQGVGEGGGGWLTATPAIPSLLKSDLWFYFWQVL